MEIVRICCKNDMNGNPRRGWLILEGGRARFVEEGYSGLSALRIALGLPPTGEPAGPYPAVEIAVMPAEFRALKRMDGAE